jgi:hypothetical protein
MSIRPFRSRLGATIAAAALAVLVSAGLLGGVLALFLRNGFPFEQVVIAARACTESTYVSDREACMRAFAAASSRSTVASR